MGKGPQFVEYFGPMLDALRELGDSARPIEVEDWIASNLNVPTEMLDAELPSGGSRFKNRVHWARFYLAKAGLIDSSVRGVWRLTDEGREARLDHKRSLELFYDTHDQFKSTDLLPAAEPDQEEMSEILELEDYVDHKSGLLELLMKLPPDGFERLCQRILRESGFQKVIVTGRSQDGGIDGHGILRVNPLVSFYVYFQCKRYSHPVGSPVVRDFRGAMVGRADKGIILTTAVFTNEARKEAVRDGVPPIELVDGDALIEILENLELGLNPRTVYDVDERFFVEFGHQL
jgi:restriction system protein